MASQSSTTARELIEEIQTRYHEGHRRAFQRLRAVAGALPADRPAQDLTATLLRLFDELEQHMFKEEMRLFPMMEQGGNRLIAQLIGDLQADHGAAMVALYQQLQRLAADLCQAAALQPLLQGLEALAAALALHIEAEEQRLFPRSLAASN